MRRNNNNINLFWYGALAKLQSTLGGMIIFAGMFLGIIFQSIWIFIIAFIIGVFLLAKGSSQRFDYQRQSGHIMHGGDGW